MAVLQGSVDRAPGVVAALLSAAGGALLTARAVRTVVDASPAGPGAVAVVVLAALLAVAAAATALRTPRRAAALALGAAVLAVVSDALPTAPPRLLALLPLALAAALLAARVPALTRPARRPWALALGWLALAVHAALGVPYLLAGLVAPWYGVALLWGVWGALLVLAVRLLRDRPLWTLAVPPATVAGGALVLLAGEHLFGWMA
ncbi:hypothetical protein CLV92_102347 [Kineococcus xinjiangensis]|uniref:Uncharacterized protein n=1 Tax=Kineococcus xinjiangensis TaxID=512762 RepID=A0A2S6IVU9_9ACTN|nr:hypothetical protein [Kineococcus xinjiangensis]PPK98194.1 hypothetical protein CLV92_102347 [Kineococcus xinjiangensis]